jgi:hypothetical protein
LTDFGAYESEMEHLSNLSDQELDRLLAGKEPSDDGALDELADFLQKAAALLPETPARSTANRHIAAMVATAQQLSESDSRDSEPSVNPSRADRKAHRFRTRRKPVFKNPLSGLAGKMALVAVVVLAVFGGTAYAGALPDGVQGAVADVADSLGVSLPDADNDSVDGAVSDVDEGALDDSDDSTVDDQGDDYPDHQGTLADDQGDDDQGTVDEDDQGDDDQGDQGTVDEDDQGDQGDQGSVNEDDQGDQGSVNEDDQGDGDN